MYRVTFFKWANPDIFFIYFLSFQLNNSIFTKMWKIFIQYPAPGFDLTPSWLWVSSLNHWARAPAPHLIKSQHLPRYFRLPSCTVLMPAFLFSGKCSPCSPFSNGYPLMSGFPYHPEGPPHQPLPPPPHTVSTLKTPYWLTQSIIDSNLNIGIIADGLT